MPLAKTGGLGDVCGALPLALEKLGHECSVFLPAYRCALRSSLPMQVTPVSFTISIGGRHVACRVLRTKLPNSNVTVYLIDQPAYFDREGLYGDKHVGYRDNCERFAFFCRATMESIEQLGLKVDVIHSHDWQTGLIPAYVATDFGNYHWTKQAATMFTIHNLAYQGQSWHYDMLLTGMDWKYFNWHQMEFYGELNLMKTGIVFANSVTTVSPTYAREITTPEHGCALDGVLRDRGQSLIGIVNGVDYAHWNPAHDKFIANRYDASNWQQGKAACKAALQQELGLEFDPHVPLIGIVSRLADQKGWDLIIPLLQQFLHEKNIQWVILGTGEARYEDQLQELGHHARHKIAAVLKFDESLAHRIEAGSDMFLMPSRYEPCGLNQLYSLKYGAVPIVHATGGLVDTVKDATPQNIAENRATGFRFEGYNLESLRHAVERAVSMYASHSDIWGQIVECGMHQDWSWEHSAGAYERAYQQILVPALVMN